MSTTESTDKTSLNKESTSIGSRAKWSTFKYKTQSNCSSLSLSLAVRKFPNTISTPLTAALLQITGSSGTATTLKPLSTSRHSVTPDPHPIESTLRALEGIIEMISSLEGS